MQRYGRDNHLVWSAEKSAVLRRGGEEGMALDVGDGVAWLERAEEAVVLGHVQAMEARGVRLPDKLVRGFRALLVVLRHHPPSVQTTLYYLRAVLNAAVGNQGMYMQQPCPKQTKPTSSNSCSTNHENLPRDIPTRNPHHVYTPSAEHNTGTAHTGTTGTAHTPTSMRAPPAPIHPGRRPSTGTTNRQPPHVPSAYASGYHRQPCPATQTTGSAWQPRTASPTAPTAGTSTPTTTSGPRPQPHPPPPATPASSGSSPTPSGTTWEGTTWRTRRTTHGP